MDFRHESRQGASSSPLRDTLANAQDYAHWVTLGSVGPVLTYVRGLVIPEHMFPGPFRPIIEAPHSNNHKGEKYINVRAGKSLTPP